MKKIMIVGIGNLLMQDDGVGVHVIRALEQLDLPEGIELVDGGTHSYDLVEYFCEPEILIIVDAMHSGGEPGTIYRAPLEELGLKPVETITCLHEMHFIEAMEMVYMLGFNPRTIVFGIEPAVVGLGLELSPQVAEKLPRLVELIQIEIDNLMSK
ncbi:MAG: hydrogenase maturation protease [Firmicutes bacterium]|nr:hydrogenase maturation protease [Bacillota bacterium]